MIDVHKDPAGLQPHPFHQYLLGACHDFIRLDGHVDVGSRFEGEQDIDGLARGLTSGVTTLMSAS